MPQTNFKLNIMIVLIRRWCMLLGLTLINATLFDFTDWQFWVMAILISISVGNLFESNSD